MNIDYILYLSLFYLLTCTWYRYKTFIHYQKKKERKEKHLTKGKVQYLKKKTRQ